MVAVHGFGGSSSAIAADCHFEAEGGRGRAAADDRYEVKDKSRHGYARRVADRIRRGDFYEDCASQPVLCTEVNYSDDWIAGISLLTGAIDSCSIENCGVRMLSQDEALDRAVGWEQWASERGLESDRSKS
jgi:hypothetical protein